MSVGPTGPAGPTGTFNGATVSADIIPTLNNTYSLGSPTGAFLNLYAANVGTSSNPVANLYATNIGVSGNAITNLYVTNIIAGNTVLPNANNAYNLGNTQVMWHNLYVGTVTSVGSNLNLTSPPGFALNLTAAAGQNMNLTTFAGGNFRFTGPIGTDFDPITDNNYQLGSNSARWSNVNAVQIGQPNSATNVQQLFAESVGNSNYPVPFLYAGSTTLSGNLALTSNNVYSSGSLANYWSSLYATNVLATNLGTGSIPVTQAFITNLGTSTVPTSQAYITTLGSATTPTTQAYIANLGSSATPTTQAYITTLGSTLSPTTTAFMSAVQTNNILGLTGQNLTLTPFNGFNLIFSGVPCASATNTSFQSIAADSAFHQLTYNSTIIDNASMLNGTQPSSITCQKAGVYLITYLITGNGGSQYGSQLYKNGLVLPTNASTTITYAVSNGGAIYATHLKLAVTDYLQVFILTNIASNYQLLSFSANLITIA